MMEDYYKIYDTPKVIEKPKKKYGFVIIIIILILLIASIGLGIYFKLPFIIQQEQTDCNESYTTGFNTGYVAVLSEIVTELQENEGHVNITMGNLTINMLAYNITKEE